LIDGLISFSFFLSFFLSFFFLFFFLSAIDCIVFTHLNHLTFPYILCLQICSEFQRISNINLLNHFYSELDRHSLKLIALYRVKAGGTGRMAAELRNILRIYDLQVSQLTYLKIQQHCRIPAHRRIQRPIPVCLNHATSL